MRIALFVTCRTETVYQRTGLMPINGGCRAGARLARSFRRAFGAAANGPRRLHVIIADGGAL